MRQIAHHEKTVHILTAIGFLGAAAFFILFPNLFNGYVGFVVLFFLLGLKTLGNIIVDSHNVMTHFKK